MQMLSLFQLSLGWAWINSPPAWPGCFSLEWVGLGLFLGFSLVLVFGFDLLLFLIDMRL